MEVLRPFLSPNLPKNKLPKGRMKNPSMKTKKAEISAKVGSLVWVNSLAK